MPVPDELLTAGLEITGHFEDSDEPLAAVSGNFDGMGISLGVLQWNIGSNSLQPIVRGIGQATALASMPNRGADLWKACNTSVAEGLAIVRAWQPNNKLPADVRAELKAFVKSSPFQKAQLETARKVGDRAWDLAVSWATAQQRPTASKKEFCWFYDVLTQNGSMKSVTFDSVKAFIAGHGAHSADDVVCDWLANCTPPLAGAKDANKNATEWRNNVPDESMVLFVASYLRAGEAKSEWRADVLNRKGTIAVGKGWVHAGKHDLSAITG